MRATSNQSLQVEFDPPDISLQPKQRSPQIHPKSGVLLYITQSNQGNSKVLCELISVGWGHRAP